MEVKEIIDRHFSRKAEIVVATQGTIILLCRVTDVDAAVLRMAMVIAGVIGLVGLVVQGILDWKHPKASKGDGLTVSTWVGPTGDVAAGPVPAIEQEPLLKKPVRVPPFDTKHPPENRSPAGQA